MERSVEAFNCIPSPRNAPSVTQLNDFPEVQWNSLRMESEEYFGSCIFRQLANPKLLC